MTETTPTLGWRLDIPPTIDPRRPGIVELRTEGDAFIVRATVIATAIRQYEDSVSRLREGLPHRVGAYRAIHHALAAAGAGVTVTALENCDPADLALRKRHWTALRAGAA